MTLRDVDVEYEFDDPDDGWFGQALPVDSAVPTVDGVPQPGPVQGEDDWNDSADTDRWYVEDLNVAMAGAAAPAVVPEPAVREPLVPEPTWTPYPDRSVEHARTSWESRSWESRSWESRLSHSGAWDFQTVSSTSPWYRSKGALVALLAAAVLAVGVAVVVLFVGSRGPAVDDTSITPGKPSAEPTGTSAAPKPSASTAAPVPPPAAPPPPLLPPPPPPSAEQASPPVTRQYSPPQRQTSSEPSRPEINVTRTPMSATPPPPPRPDRNSSTPGDAPKRGGWGF